MTTILEPTGKASAGELSFIDYVRNNFTLLVSYNVIFVMLILRFDKQIRKEYFT